MITPVRAEILRLLTMISETENEFRFGQLIANLANWAKGPWNETLWDMEDEELLPAVIDLHRNLQNRINNPATNGSHNGVPSETMTAQ